MREMRDLLIKNKKGQIESVLLAVITIFIIGIIILFMNHLNKQVYSSLDDYLKENPKYNDTEAQHLTEKFDDIEGSRIWDYSFLAIFVGILIQMLIFSFASRVNIAFFWIFILMGIVILLVGTVLSSIWQEMSQNPVFSETIERFVITNAILGTYYPTIVTAILFLAMIVLFGKFPGGEQG